MSDGNRYAKVNVTVLIVLILVLVAAGTSLFAAREVRRNILSKMNLETGQNAYEEQDWANACKYYQRYLSRNPDDIEVLKKYATARLSTRPLDAEAVGSAIAAYRRILQLDPFDEAAFEKLPQLYAGTGNFEELAYIARSRLDLVPEDKKAPLWLAEALIRLHKSDDARETLDGYVKKLAPLADKPPEYIQACALLSQILVGPGSVKTSDEALELLNSAVTAFPESAEALTYRARFFRTTSEIPEMTENERMEAARRDLEAADAFGTENLRTRLLLGAEWLGHNEIERTDAELQAVGNPPAQIIEKYFFDERDWTVEKYLLESQLAIKRKDAAEGVKLTDAVLEALAENNYRVRVLPSAVAHYVAGGNVADANDCLDEYLKVMYTQEGSADSRLELAYIRALVATAEEKPYAVIDILQPVVVSDAARPELWRLLADAFSQTDQTRREIGALAKYLRIVPQDSEMTQRLTKEYIKMRQWQKAYDTVQLADAMDPTDIVIRLLRIEASIYRIVDQSAQIDPNSFVEMSKDLTKLRKEDPNRVDIRILQASIADLLDKPEEAEKELKQAIEECSDRLPAQMQLAEHYQRVGLKDEAVSICQTACEDNPELAEPWLTLSGLHVTQADYDSAGDALELGLKSVVGKWEKRPLQIQSALLELYKDDPNEAAAISILSGITEQDTQEVRARYLLLSIREVQQNIKITDNQPTAEELIKQLKDAEGESGIYWRLCQMALWLSADDWRSRQQDITAAAQQCIDLDPEWSAPALLLANMYEKLEDFRRVEQTYYQALARNPSADDVGDALISLLEKQGRYADAQDVLSRINQNPRWTSAWQIGIAMNSGDFSRAIEELRMRVKYNDRDANSRILLARLYYQRGDAVEADKLLNEAEAIAPDSMVLVAAKVAILRAAGKSEEARNTLDEYVENNPSFGAYMMRAIDRVNTGEPDLAEEDYRELTNFPQKEVDGYELLSDFYVRTQRLDDAVTYLKIGRDKYPQDLRLKRRLMKTLFLRSLAPDRQEAGRAQDQQEAIGILGDLEGKLPNDPELMKIRAMLLLSSPSNENLQAAAEKLQKVVNLEPTAIDAHLKLIDIEIHDKKFEVARDSAIRALGSNPDNPALLSARAKAELLLKNTQMAAQLAQLALEADPNNAQAKDVIITAALNIGDMPLLKQALTLVDSALGDNPANEELLLLRVSILTSMKKPETAIPEMEAYYRTGKGKSSIPALMALAELYRLTGNTDMAGQIIDQAEKLDSNSLAVIHGRLLLLASQKRFDELTQISSAYLAAKEQNPTFLVADGKILASSNSTQLKKEALKLFERAVSLAPTMKDARVGLASTLYQTGDADRAVAIYEELKRQYPNDKQVLNDLAWIMQEHEHRYDEALKLINRALVFATDNEDLLDTRAAILFNMGGHLQEAKDDYERIVKLAAPDSRKKAAALLNLGRTCLKLNESTEAKKHLQEALDIDRKNNVFTESERSEITTILRAE